MSENDNRERVKQRLTFNKSFLNIYNKKSVYIGFRASIEYLEKLDFIAHKLRARNISETIRESIDITYAVLSGANIDVGTVVIQNPVVNIVKNEAKAETTVNVDLGNVVKIIQRLYSLREPLPPLQKKLIEKLYNEIKKKMVN